MVKRSIIVGWATPAPEPDESRMHQKMMSNSSSLHHLCIIAIVTIAAVCRVPVFVASRAVAVAVFQLSPALRIVQSFALEPEIAIMMMMMPSW